MFEIVGFAASSRKSIRLDTRQGNHVDNEQSLPPDQQTVTLFDRVVDQHTHWVVRKECCGIYNCFGHVWASRRTCIYDEEEVRKILHEDGYREINLDLADRGDIALYLWKDSDTIWHAGVIEPRAIQTNIKGDARTVPWVISKLNDTMGEVFHPINDIHTPSRLEFDVSIWTDRIIH